ncbi:VWA domain-containing protein [Aggregatilineales bacterium SYSU G02658]
MRGRWMLSVLVALAVLAGCTGSSGGGSAAVPANAIEISIIYAPESADYLPTIMNQFNESYRQGINPVTGQRLAAGERPIFITGRDGSSGTIMQGIVNAVLTPNSENVARPTIFQPSVRHWLALANYQARRELFDLGDSPATANAPVVMAIWESRLRAIRQTVGYDDIGWEELLMVINSANGWQDFGLPNARRTVFYGHTDPFVSSTGLSTLIAEFYAAARAAGIDERTLSLATVNNEEVREGVRAIEQLIRHYSTRTTEFKNYIAQGPEYLDFVALEENDLIAINRGLTAYQPPERLVALYPKEGTFFHDHPMAVVNANWVTDEQRAAARVFIEYVRLPAQQEYIMQFGFRPVIPGVPLGFPFEEQYGVTKEGPSVLLDAPPPDVIAAVQNTWEFVKKQADIMLLIDVSGSMAQDNKLEQAKIAALAFLDRMESNNRIGLAVFSDNVRIEVPLDNFETNIAQMRQRIQQLGPEGGTSLYDAVVDIVTLLSESTDSDRIRAIVLLSDGEDTTSRRFRLADVEAVIRATRNELNPIIVVPVGYGRLSDDLIRVLQRIAAASNTTWQSGDPNNIGRILELISSFF